MPAISKLTDKQLLFSLERLVSRSQRTTAELVAHIGEVDARGIYRKQACSSMFVYCVQRLHLSEAAAAKRIHVARAARRFDGLLDYIADGRVHLSGMALLVPHLNDDNWRTVVERAVHKSKREIELIVARLAPRQDVVASMRRVPVRSSCKLSPSGAAGTTGPEPAGDSSAPLMQLSSGVRRRGRDRSAVEPLAPGRFKVQFTADQSLRDKIAEAQALQRHSNPDGDLAQLFEKALDLWIETQRAKRFGLTRSPRRTKKAPRVGSRHIPAAVRRAVYVRDGGQCTYVDDQGRQCSETAMLEYDHIVPHARGGPSTTDNLRLRCRAHNQLHAEEAFGRELIVRMQAR